MINRNVVFIAITVFVLLVLVKIFNISYPIELRVVNSNVQSEMAVTGTGKVDVVPDVAYIDAGITISRAKSAEEAKTRMTTVNNKIIEAVKALGIEKEDITTSNFSINPEYDYSGNPIPLDAVTEPAAGSGVAGSSGTQAIPEKIVPPVEPSRSRIVGYNGTATVAVKVRDSSKTAMVIQKVTEAGANNVGSPRFAVDSPEKYQEQAREKAITNAKEQAQKLAKQLGIRLGGITNMVENGGYPVPVYDRAYGGTMMNAEAKSVPPTIEEGQQTVTSTVTLYFERK